ncbi:MAG: CoA-binding protein [Actinobacteria bacterium]|nr:CoA-binding protein [Actinomycetota bacterium]MCG2818122.1 CoA-binding protein [Actinomycetes bacterium]MBU4179606.1 CoA-binding protein [Actinomycetota bacterium]MBU4218925.1 CoA-binding protein [Actinomycetota bacterium]MBU4359672.1 CoA-binding protein [Actinomycetota bacterium]
MKGLDEFFHPGSVAVVGASRTPGKAGNTVVSNILEFGFEGRLYPVNPGAGDVLGLRCYEKLSDVPETPDLVVGVLPREKTPDLVLQCSRAGVRHLILPTAGFSDVGEEGRLIQEEILSLAREAGIRLMGPNSIGTVCTSGNLATSIVTLDRIREGGISLFGQTGMFSSGIARWIDTSEHFGISKIACLGNKADVDESDLLEYLSGDVETRVIGVYTEGVRGGARFARVLKDVASRKPVLVLKSGRTETGRRAIASHTGALSGSEGIFAGLIEQAGAVRVGDFEEMFDCARAFEWQPLPRGNRVGVVSITGVGCVLAADCAGEFGLEMPIPASATVARMRESMPRWVPAANPADIWAAIEAFGPESAYTTVSRALLDDDAVDSLVVIFTVIPEAEMDVKRLFERLKEDHPEKPLAAVLMAGDAGMRSQWKRSLETSGFPTYTSPERALRAIGAMWRYAS